MQPWMSTTMGISFSLQRCAAEIRLGLVSGLNMLEDAKNLANIFFFITVAVVGILSYLHARKTVFAPIRTETFKLQLKVFEELLVFFQRKSEHEFPEVFDFPRIVQLNALQMRDAYAKLFFHDKLKLDEELQKKAYAPLTGALISAKDLQVLDVDSDPLALTPPKEPPPETPALVLAKWKSYEHSAIGYTDEHQKQVDELMRLAASPLIPEPLRELLLKFCEAVHENLRLIESVLTDAARLMPDKFNSADKVINFHTDWIWNDFNHRARNFEPLATDILRFVKQHLQIEELTKQ